jgi:hypothetical protein
LRLVSPARIGELAKVRHGVSSDLRAGSPRYRRLSKRNSTGKSPFHIDLPKRSA